MSRSPLAVGTSVPNHIASERQDLGAPVGLTFDLWIEDGAFILGDSAGLGIQVDEIVLAADPFRPGSPASHGANVRPERAGQRLLAVADRGPLPEQHRRAGAHVVSGTG